MKKTRIQVTRALAPLLLVLSQPVSAINIQLNYVLDTTGFFNDPIRRSVLESAASFYEGRITDSLAAIAPSAGNSWGGSFRHPTSGQVVSIVNRSIAADTLEVFVGARNMTFGLADSSTSVGTTLGPASPEFLTLVSTRGQDPGPDAFNPTDYGPWGGSLSFDPAVDWYFDTDTSTDEAFTGLDAYSVALHELGHILGSGSTLSWLKNVKNVAGGGAAYTGTNNATALFGGDIPIDSLNQHWAFGVTSTIDGVGDFGVNFTGIPFGERRRVTDLDLAGLQDAGWQVSAATVVPVPAAVWLFSSGLIGLVAVSRRRISIESL